MFGIYTYFVIMLIFAGIPLFFMWLTSFNLLLKYKRIFLYVLIGCLIFGGAWDYVAIKEGVWSFTNILGVWILGLPVEEWVFIMIIGLSVSSLTLITIKKGDK